METQTIPADEWIGFFQAFSRDHAGEAVSIEVLDPESGPQNLAQDLPLEGISFDTKGTRPTSVEISAGDRPDRHITHVVDMPLHIRQASQPGGPIDIEIEPARGPVTLIHVESRPRLEHA